MNLPKTGDDTPTNLAKAGSPPPRVVSPESYSKSGGRVQRPLEPTNLSGSTIDQRFHILSRIGAGGMSEVYKAEHIILQKIVAIKVLHKQQEAQDHGIERFQQEAKAISTLDHPNIVKVYAFGASETDQLYLVMDYLEGKSLAEILSAEGHLSWDRATNLVRQIAEGLEQAHSRGIVHRDLKPSNIIIQIDEAGCELVKIVDFGIAKLTVDSGKEIKKLTHDGNTCGSPPYMSPEQCMGEVADARADVYSLGVMTYELLIGKRPISGRSSMETMQNHLNQTPPLFSMVEAKHDIPKSLEAIVRKCLEKDPDYRYQNMHDLKADLNQVGTSSKKETLLESTQEKISAEIELSERSKTIRKGVIAVAVIIALTSGFGFLWFTYCAPQQKFLELKTEIASIDTSKPGYGRKVKRLLPPLLQYFEQQKDLSSAQACVKRIQKKVQKATPNIEQMSTLREVYKSLKQVRLDSDANKLATQTVGASLALANQYALQNNLADAEIYYTECLRISSDSNQPLDIKLTVLNYLFSIYVSQHRFLDADHVNHTAISLASEGSNLDKTLALINRGNLMMEQELYLEAEKIYRKCWEASVEDYSPSSTFSQNIAKLLIRSLKAQGKDAQIQEFLNSTKEEQ